MALQKNLVLNIYGETLTIKKSYLKITNLNGNKEKMQIQLTALTNDKNSVIKDFFFTFTPNSEINSKEITTQAYEFIKNQDDFKDSVDV